MESTFGDLKEIFSTPPTEARYSWVIHSGHQTLEGSSLRRNPAAGFVQQVNAEEETSNLPSNIPGSPANLTQMSQRNEENTTNILHSTNQQSSSESAIKRVKPNDTEEEMIQHAVDVETTIDTQPKQSKQTPPPPCLPRSPRYSQPKYDGIRSSSRRHSSRIEDEKEDHAITTDDNLHKGDMNSSFSECGSTRVFGDSYEQTKRFVRSQSQRPKRLQQRNENRDEAFGEYQYKNLRLQEELHSANKKINRLNQINHNALKRKGELQKEVLDAYKKISELEVSRHSWNEQQRELSLELKTVKQRVGEAEREAAYAIGECYSKIQRYF